MTRSAIRHQLALSRLVATPRPGYGLPPPHHPYALRAAALLACGPGALLSHATAGELWGFSPPDPATIHVLVHGRNPGRPEGVTVHRTAIPPPAAVKDRLPLTSPFRTLQDLKA